MKQNTSEVDSFPKIWEQASIYRHTAPTSLLILFIIDLYYFTDEFTEFNYTNLTFFIRKSTELAGGFRMLLDPSSRARRTVKPNKPKLLSLEQRNIY